MKNAHGTITVTSENVTTFDRNINISPNKITIGANQRVTFKTLGDAEELILGANSSAEVTDLNNHLFTNPTDQEKTVPLGENTTTADQDNPYA